MCSKNFIKISVKTKLNSGGLISPKFAAQKIINLCATKTLKFNGKFIGKLNKENLESTKGKNKISCLFTITIKNRLSGYK